MSINDDVESIYRHINPMLRDGDYGMRWCWRCATSCSSRSPRPSIELGRINPARSNTKASSLTMLYLTIPTETKNMVLQSATSRNRSSTFKHRAGKLQRWIKPTK